MQEYVSCRDSHDKYREDGDTGGRQGLALDLGLNDIRDFDFGSHHFIRSPCEIKLAFTPHTLNSSHTSFFAALLLNRRGPGNKILGLARKIGI